MKILNFGSLNIDYSYIVDHIVIKGETLSAIDRKIYCGGKGLNQSLALARAGSEVWHAGAVGESDGQVLFDVLNESGVNLNFLKRLSDSPSGHTIIQVDKDGQNCIIVFGGANQKITRKQIDSTFKHFSEGDYIILQNEINECPYIMDQARNIGMKIVLNPSPMDEKIKQLPLEYVDFFVVNEIEANQLVSGSSDEELLENFSKYYPDSHIIMTVGARGAYYSYKNTIEHHGVFNVKRVDTTGAGDTFTGFFISEFSQGESPTNCLKFASAASSIAVSRAGASTSIPTKNEVSEFIKKIEAV